MKVIYLHQYYTSPEMAGGTRSYEMARRMVAAGHEVHMVTSYREQDVSREGWFQTKDADIQVHWYPVPYSNHMSFFQRLKAFFSFALAARKKALQLDADIIFATSTPLTIALPAVPASRKTKVPMVFEVRDLWPEMPIAVGALRNPLLRFAARRLEHWAYHNAAAVVALSPGMKRGVLRTGYPAAKVAVIPNSSDNVEFQYNAEAGARFRAQREWLGDKPLLVYSGTFGRVNGVAYIIPVAQELLRLKSDVRILLVGEGAEKEEVVHQAEQAGVLWENLFIEGMLPKKEMPALLCAATMASNLVIDLVEARANSANKFFDALAAGKPIFLNHGGWMHEMVEAKGCGLAMWRQSAADVAAELDKKLHDKEWLAQAGKSARLLAEKHFDRDVLADQLIQVLQAAVDGQAELAAKIAPGEYRF